MGQLGAGNAKGLLTFVPLWIMGCYREGTAWMETHNNLTKRFARWWLSPHSRWTEWVESCWVHLSRQRPRPARIHSQESVGLCAAAAVWTGAGSPSGLHSGALWHLAHLGAVSSPPGKRVDWSPSTQSMKSQPQAISWETGSSRGMGPWLRGRKPRLLTNSANNSLCDLWQVLSPSGTVSLSIKWKDYIHLLVMISSVSSHSPSRGSRG